MLVGWADMVVHTRLDCGLGSAGLMRQASRAAVFHAEHRSAFKDKLINKPAMRNVLADLALESEAALRMVRGREWALKTVTGLLCLLCLVTVLACTCRVCCRARALVGKVGLWCMCVVLQVLRTAKAFDARSDPREQAFLRIATAVTK